MISGVDQRPAPPAGGDGREGNIHLSLRENGMEIEALLRKTHLCNALDEGEIGRLRSIVRARKFRRGETLFMEGEPAEGFFLLLEGCVRILKCSPEGKELLLHRIRPGEMFAEAAVFGDGRYPAHGVAETEVTTAFVPKEPFFRLLRASPALSLKMMAGLAGFAREFNRRLEALSLHGASARLAAFLLEELERRGTRSFRLDLPRAALAARLGMAPETLSRNLTRLKREGLVAASGRSVTIHDPARLRRIAAGEADGT